MIRFSRLGALAAAAAALAGAGPGAGARTAPPDTSLAVPADSVGGALLRAEAAADTSGPAPDAAEVAAALDTLGLAERALVVGVFEGDSLAMARSSEHRLASLRLLDRAAARHPERIRELVWPDRVRWLHAALEGHRPDWSRRLVEALGGELPERDSSTRAPLALAEAMAALEAREAGGGALPDTAAALSLEAIHAALVAAGESVDFRLRDEALYRLWSLAEAAGDSAAALGWADSLIAVNPASLRAPRVRLTRARAFFAAGRAEEAVNELRLAPPEVDTAEIHWLLARIRLSQGYTHEAAHELEAVVGRFPADSLAVPAYALRVRLGESDPDLYLTAEGKIQLLALLLPQAASGAEAALAAFADSAGLPAVEREAAGLALGRWLYRARRYAEAGPVLTGLARSGSPRTRDEADLILARGYRNTGRAGPMEKRYRAVIGRRGPDAATAAWELGRELESGGKWKEAEKVYTLYLERFPRTTRLRDARFRRGFDRVRENRPEAAVEDFRAAFDASITQPDQEQAAFWLARTLKRLGRDDDAGRAARAGAWKLEPADYYGVRLREEFGLPGVPPDRPEAVSMDPHTSFESAAVDAGWPGPVESRYFRGLDLARLGEFDAARAEWNKAAEVGASGSPNLVELLALAAAAHHIYPEGVRWANQALQTVPAGYPTHNGYARLAYPAAYYGEVESAARAAGVEPELVWALMRQESLYQPTAVSRAGARGLLQVTPATLARIVRESGSPPLPVEALFRPEINIPLGVGFLRDRLREFDGHLMPTLAGYNAGEGKAREWLERADGDSDEVFVECIGYPETYGYVRRVVWLTWIYRHYYTSGPPPVENGPEAR